MNTFNKALFSILILLLANVGFACDYPSERVKIPAGDAVDKESLLAAQAGVKTYMATLATYRECIVEEEKLARLAMENLTAEVEQQREEMLNKKFNAAVEDEERVAAEFNAAVQAYNKNKQ